MALTKEEKEAKKVADAEAKAAAKAQAEADKALGASDKGVTRVRFEGGVREFSKEVHGADHAKLAAEFAGKDERRKVL